MKIKNGIKYTYKNKYSAHNGFSGTVYDYDGKTFTIFTGSAWLILVEHRTILHKIKDYFINEIWK